MSGKNWKTLDVVLGLVGGLCGLIGIVTGIKSASYDEEQNFKTLEDRYGLTPVSNEEDN